jgi:hypothetical protein
MVVSAIVDRFVWSTAWRRNSGRARSSRNPASTITHDPAHADMPHEVTVIKGRRFPTCRHCKGISFALAHSAKHVSEIDHFEEAHAPAQ